MAPMAQPPTTAAAHLTRSIAPSSLCAVSGVVPAPLLYAQHDARANRLSHFRFLIPLSPPPLWASLCSTCALQVIASNHGSAGRESTSAAQDISGLPIKLYCTRYYAEPKPRKGGGTHLREQARQGRRRTESSVRVTACLGPETKPPLYPAPSHPRLRGRYMP